MIQIDGVHIKPIIIYYNAVSSYLSTSYTSLIMVEA